jgi:hypothetical protein
MAKKKEIEVLSVEDLKALQEKVASGVPLTDLEKAQLDASIEAQAEDEATAKRKAEFEAEQEAQVDRIANLIARKLTFGAAPEGGKPHVPLSAKAVAALPKQTQEERAEEYYKNMEDASEFPWPGIHVTSDLNIFLGNPLGENALANHVASSVVNGVASITYKSFPKPN